MEYDIDELLELIEDSESYKFAQNNEMLISRQYYGELLLAVKQREELREVLDKLIIKYKDVINNENKK